MCSSDLATSAVPTFQAASAEDIIAALTGRRDILSAIGEAAIRAMSDEQLVAVLASRAQGSSQGSAQSEVLLY